MGDISGATITITEGNVVTPDNLKLYTRTYTPTGNIVGTITFVHGFGEHIGRYEHVFPVYSAAGFIINAFDHRGHGKSEGPRAHTPAIENSLNDISLIVAKADPTLPHFIYGHSMGGAFSLLYLERLPHQFTGAIITDPLIKLHFTVPALKVAVGRLVSKIAPQHAMYNELRPEALSRDQEIGKKYVEDPLVLRNITTRMGSVLLDMGDWIITDAPKITVPILMVHGTADTVTSIDATKQVYGLVSSSDKTLKLFEGWYHEPHNEIGKEELFALVTDWLKNHIPKN